MSEPTKIEIYHDADGRECLRVYGPPLEGDLFDRMRRHDCGGGVA